MEQVEEICRHIVLVNKGKKILDGTVEGIKHDFKNLFGIQLETLPARTANRRLKPSAPAATNCWCASMRLQTQ